MRFFIFASFDRAAQKLSAQQPRLIGYELACAGIFILSFDAVLIRLVDAPVFTLLLWRSSGLFLICWLAVLLLEKRSLLATLKKLGRTGLAVSVLMAGSNVGFVAAVSLNSVAETLIIVATTPMITVVLATFTGEKPRPRALLAAFVAFLGVAILFSEEILRMSLVANGEFNFEGSTTTLGRAMALGTAFIVALVLILMRRQKAPSYSGSFALAGLFGALFSAFFYESGIIETNPDKIIFVLVSALVLPVSFVLYGMSPRFISAPEASLVLLIETVLGPAWVWLFIGEKPSALDWVGGTMVIGSIIVNSWLSIREARAWRQNAVQRS